MAVTATTQRKQLGQLLVDIGKITPQQLDEALLERSRTDVQLGNILVNKGFVTEEEMLQILSRQMEIPYQSLDGFTILPEDAKLVPANTARKYSVIPLFRIEDTLQLGMENPLDIDAIDAVQRATGLTVEPILCLRRELERAIELTYGVQRIEQTFEKLAEAPQLMDDTDVVELVNRIISQAVQVDASDIHLEPREHDLRVRYRIDGRLQEFHNPPKELTAALISRIKIMSDLDIAESRRPQDGRIRFTEKNRMVDLRVSTFLTVHGEKVVLRILDMSKAKIRLDDLGVRGKNLDRLRSSFRHPNGIVLVSGPTGSGKTTTLYAALNELNSIERNILTVEDPIEYELEGINQSQVNLRAGLTFANALRTMLRQDPDIIMVGEIRDAETAELSIRAALTGHLILSTIHTNDAAGAISRLDDMEIEPFLITSTIRSVIAQRLIRVICPSCKTPETPNPELLKRLRVNPNKSYNFQKATGCRECRQLGYRGRMGIFEIIIMNEEINRIIIERGSTADIRNAAVRAGMVTLRQAGLRLAALGQTSLDEIVAVTGDIVY